MQRYLALPLAMTLAGCVGMVGDGEADPPNPADPGGNGGGAGGAPPGGAGGSPATPPPAVGPSRPRAPLRRLSRGQYNNTVRDLLGDTTRPADAFLGEEVPGSFSGSAALAQAAPAAVEQYRTAAECLA